MENCYNSEYCQAFDELKIIHDRLKESEHHPTLSERFYALLVAFYRIVRLTPEQARIVRLSSTRATSSSMYALQWRVKSLLASLGDSSNLSIETDARWQQRRSEQISFFVAGVSDTFLLLNELKSAEDRSAFLLMLKAEMDGHVGKYTSNQVAAMKKAYEEIASKIESDADLSELTPEWFIPWYELVVDEWNCLGEGGFGSVHRAKWLDSDVVVKRVTLSGSHSDNCTYTSDSAWEHPSGSRAPDDDIKRAEALAMFRREVEIWFGLSHPHVVRLFGACHVGRPFFVCEYATKGILTSYLRKHPDEIWSKLHEAALGIQYLHARNVVHGDLKGNNIVIGSDMKAKVTDFGLSSLASSEDKALVSGAWQWVAPELLGTNQCPTFASDIYSLGMCIVETLRIVEAVKLSRDPHQCLPWRITDRAAVKYHATRGKLPSRPSICEDAQWELVGQMCVLKPEQRIKISTVVDELAKLADPTQPDDLGQLNSVSWESVAKVISAAQEQLARLQDSDNQRDGVLSLHVLLWDRIERLHGQIDGNQSEKCRGAFCSLVADADEATATLQDRSGTLVSLAQTTMQYYALDRALSKWCDAYCISYEDKGLISIPERIERTSLVRD